MYFLGVITMTFKILYDNLYLYPIKSSYLMLKPRLLLVYIYIYIYARTRAYIYTRAYARVITRAR